MSKHSLPLLLLAAALGACSGEPSGPPREPIHDLIAELPLAEIRREPGVVDLGTPEARALLIRGWSHDEEAEGRTFVWSEGPESEMEVFLAAPRDVAVSFRGMPFEAPGAPAQRVAVLANGREVAEVGFGPGEAEQRIELPAKALRAGSNRLTFRYAWTRSPREVRGGRSSDTRRLAVAWDVLRFETGAEEGARVRVVGDRLYLPSGHRVDAFLRLPAGAALALEEVRSRGGSAALEIALQPEGGEEERIERLSPEKGAETVELGGGEAVPVRLSLAAVPEDGPPRPGSGLLLRRPRIVAPPAPAKTAESAPTAVPARAKTEGGRPANVLVYLVDTLRRDHLGCYGYGKPVSPRVDAFAREATLFRNAVAQSSWTRPSVASLLTGLLPRTHGVNRRPDALSREAVTLAEMLRDRGFRTAAFVTNGNVHRSFGFGQGFEEYRLTPHGRDTAENLNTLTAAWLDRVGEAPFFLFLHTIEPHTPYQPPPEFRQRFAPGVPEELGRVRVLKELNSGARPVTPALVRDLTALYDAEIAANDAAFGDLVALLKARGLWGSTAVVFLSDHGEEFHDHGGWEHGRTLHTEMLDVPLIVRLPGVGEGRAVDRLAQHIDLVPTLLDSLGLPVPDAVEGRSLLPAIAGAEEGTEEDAAFSWLDVDGFRAGAVSTPAWRLLDERAPEADRGLFDRRADPGEARDLAADRPVRAGFLRALLLAAEREGPRLEAGRGTVDEELRQRLRALGYVQ
ncbi:MAG TPA: sulfatase [Thermoanaerobaculia bacterium]|nr:sulfatase [Thermoanaerobaculia bacterium]